MSGRVIFLDIDGVLNSVEWTARRGPLESWRMPSEQRRAASFDPAAVARINQLVAQSGARIVLSSRWRKLGLERMREVFTSVGLRGRLVDRTPLPQEYDLALFRRLQGSERPDPRLWPRGYEIQQWLDANAGITGAVVIDDSVNVEHLEPWQVQTSMREGFIDAHIEQALAILERAPPPRSGGSGPRARTVEPGARRVIFLDIDGVLNTHESRSDDGVDRGFDRTCVERLNRLVARTGAEVVLSSARRTFYEPAEAQAMLERVGFVGRLVDRTPRRIEHDPSVHRRLAGRDPRADEAWPRGYEIQQWLDAHDDVERIVILDDRDDMHHLSPWLVRTTFRDGLRDEHVDEAARRLAAPGPVRTTVPAARPAPVPALSLAERFVFLDIDGVLNNPRSRARNEGRWRDLDPEAVARLDAVLDRTQAVVVLSSAWRKAVRIDEVQARLEASGFRGRVLDRTPSRDEHDPAVIERLGTKVPKANHGWPRGYEIQQWLDARATIAGMVILDEGHGMAHLEPWLVAIDHADGLQDAHVERAVDRLLARPPRRNLPSMP